MASDPRAVIGKRHALVTITNLPGGDRDPWSTLSGGGASGPVTRAYNGGSPKANIIAGRRVIADVITTRPFEPHRDGPLLAALTKVVTRLKVKAITRQYVDADGVRIGKPQTFSNCLLVACVGFDYDENSGDPAYISATWSPEDVV